MFAVSYSESGGPAGFGFASGTIPSMEPQTQETKKSSARSRCGRKRFGFYPGEDDIIRRMLEMRAQGAGFDKIADQLNDAAVPTRSGKVWHGRVVNRILRAELARVASAADRGAAASA